MKKQIKKKQTYEPNTLPFGVGDAIFIRTVTHHQVGRVVAIGADFFVLDDASWVPDDGRFSEALAKGKLNEIERCPGWVLVGRGSVIDIHPWTHALPKETK